MIILLCGISGTGKTTLAKNAEFLLSASGINVEIIGENEYSQALSISPGNKVSYEENLQTLVFIAGKFSNHNVVSIVIDGCSSKKNRDTLSAKYQNIKFIHVESNLDSNSDQNEGNLNQRLKNKFSDFEAPENPHLYINTSKHAVYHNSSLLTEFIVDNLLVKYGKGSPIWSYYDMTKDLI